MQRNSPSPLGKKIQWLGIGAVCLALWIGWLAGHGRREPAPATAGRTGPVQTPGISSPAPDVPPPSDEAATPAAPAAPASPAAHEASADAFRRWLGAQPEPLDPARLAEGRSLLEARRAAMVWLVRNDPRRALEQALSFAERERLPAEWTPLIEERFSTLADLSLLPDCSPGSTGTVHLFLERPGQPGLRGLAWGKLTSHQSKNRLPVEGIALEGWTALQENGVKIVSGREQEAVERLFPPAPAAEVGKNVEATALIGGQVHRFATAEAAGEMANLYARVAALPGPRSASPLTAALSGSGVPIPDQIFARAQELASSWTETPKSVLVLNTVFPDRTTPVGTQAEWQAVMSEVSSWMSGVSFGKTSLVATVPPNVFTLPSAAAFYDEGDKSNQIMTDAKARALAGGYNSANYDITVVAFPSIDVGYGGLGTIGGGNHWLNGTRNAGVIAHEFGHNYGIFHASSWDVNDGSIMPATGAPDDNDSRHIEYGDRFSVMGSSGSFTDGDFSPHGKAVLNWITPAQIQTVSSPGTYRIYRFDAATANANPKLALKLQRAGSQTFWLGYRRRFASNTYLKNGAYVLWEYTPSQCRLLDMTPESRTASHYDDKEDAALAIGRTFADPTGYLYITPTAQGGTAPNEWLDVRVEFTIAGNHPPTASINLPAQPVAARTNVALSATATDQDNDALIYSWDFGNGLTASGAAVNWTFNAGGSRQITLRVTDGKGGLAEVTQTLVVSDPLAQIEEISLPDSSQQVTDAGWLGGLQVGSSYNYTYASADGAAWHRTPGTLNFSPKRVASGAGRMVTVGGTYDNSLSKWAAASAVTSDGSVWTKPSHGTTPELNSVAFRNGLFVAVGDDGALLTSPDGAAWTPRTNPSTSTLYDVTSNATGFLACGEGGTIITSPDGTTWTQRTTPQNWPWLRKISASGAKAVTVSGNDTYWISQDSGATWESRSFNLGSFSPDGIAYGEGVWVASDSTYLSASSSYELSLAVSTDGLRWDLLAPRSLAYSSQVRLMDGRLWLYGQSGKILRSALINAGNRPPTLAPAWPAAMTARVAASLSATTGDADGDATEVLWEVPGPPYRFGSPIGQTFLFGGSKTVTAWAADARGGHTPATRTYEVDDPLLYWSNITPTTFSGTAMTAAACSSTRAVIAGGYASADAPPATATSRTAWTTRTLPLYGYDLTWRSPGFVSVGQSYDSATSSWRSAVCRSTDGQTWGALQNLAGTSLRGVAAADTAYVAVGSGGGIFRSTDGLTWNPATSGVTTDLFDVAFSGARGLAVGNGKILRSEDAGATWTDVTSTSGSATYASRVFSAGGRLYLTGQSGQLRIYQPDTRAWLDASISGTANFGSLQSIVLRGSTWVALGLLYDSALARNHRHMAASLDGITWEAGEMPWPADPGSLLDCGGNLFVTGSNMLLANVQGTPGLVLSPASLTASRGTGETGPLGTLQIGNTGAGSLNWTVSSNAAWLAATPASGTATVSGATINVTLLSARPAGANTGTLTFSAPGVPSQQVTVTVNAFVDDHGSTQASATRLTPGTAMAGNIQAADDSDWFSFDFTAPGTLKVWTTGTLDTTGELHGATGLLASNDDLNGGSNFQIERVVLPGRYWVKVDGFNANTGAYQLQSLFTAAGPSFKLKTWGLASGGTQRSFTVATAIGYRYHVQKSTWLDTGWTQVGSTVTATAEETILTIPLETATRRVYYRVAVQAP